MFFSANRPLENIFRDPLVFNLWPHGKQQLNREQRRSLSTAIRKKFQLIQGPPGN